MIRWVVRHGQPIDVVFLAYISSGIEQAIAREESCLGQHGEVLEYDPDRWMESMLEAKPAGHGQRVNEGVNEGQ